MPADDPSAARPPPVVLRIKLRYDDVDAMVQRFAPNVGKSGLFLPTRSLQPVGTEIKFGAAQWEVIGVLKPKGSNGIQDQDDIVLAPTSAVQDTVAGGRS